MAKKLREKEYRDQWLNNVCAVVPKLGRLGASEAAMSGDESNYIGVNDF